MKLLLNTVLKSLRIICLSTFLYSRCIWKFYHGWQGRSARNSGGELTGVSHSDVRNKSVGVPLQMEGLGEGSRGLLLMTSFKVLQFILSMEYVGTEEEEAGLGLGEFFGAMLR